MAAANLINAGLNFRLAIRPLFAAGDPTRTALRVSLEQAVLELWDARPIDAIADEGELRRALEPLERADQATVGVPYWTPIGVSKVLHRLAPQVVPIVDSRVFGFYGISWPISEPGRVDAARAARLALWRDVRENREELGELAEGVVKSRNRAITPLRVADILIWMHSAKDVDPEPCVKA